MHETHSIEVRRWLRRGGLVYYRPRPVLGWKDNLHFLPAYSSDCNLIERVW